MKSVSIYDMDKRLAQTMQKIQDAAISARNKEIILDFCNTASSEGLTKTRVAKIAYVCRILAEMLEKDFDIADKKDIEALIRKIHTRGIEAWTIYGYKVIVKKLYKW
ncbi:hypothetical protein HY639_03450, partial [Candidatus Woesearchaeota archaeon]|nr:hypothetical protein [Candidatus Woesearchaeota archaeon]